MAVDNTGISGTDATWSPLRGCTRVSAGCTRCYAERIAARFSGPGMPYEGTVDSNGRWNGTIRLVPEALDQPLRWKRPRRIFVNSMSDLFHSGVSDDYIDSVFAVMALAPAHTFQTLTKRPERAAQYLADPKTPGRVFDAAVERMARSALAGTRMRLRLPLRALAWPLPNAWIGVSVEDQRVVDRVDVLRQIPAAVRFLSIEPMIGPVECDLTGIHWIILGGESGHGARPCDPAWFVPLINEARRVGARVWVKQLGSVWAKANRWEDVISLERVGFDLKGGDPEIWPEDLRIQEFPA